MALVVLVIKMNNLTIKIIPFNPKVRKVSVATDDYQDERVVLGSNIEALNEAFALLLRNEIYENK